MKPSYYSKFLSAFLALVLLVPAFPTHAGPPTESIPAWEYNPGPDPSTEMGRKLIDWYAELPEFKAFADETMDKQKFRFIYGTMAFRTRLEPNSVKVAFWGQDGTHVAEFAKHTATAGFGGRAQDFANYFGVDKSAGFSNAYLSTIYGQYGAFTHPMVETDANGIPKIKFNSYVEAQLWAMSNDPLSANTLSRNAYIEWTIKNNPESLRLLVLFGGAARDAMAEFLISRGAQVGTRLNPEKLKSMRVPQTKAVSGGGNNEFVVPVDKNGNDIYLELFKEDKELKDLYKAELIAQLEVEKKKAATPGRDAELHKYAVRDIEAAIQAFERNGEVKLDYKVEAMQKIAQKALSLRETKAMKMMVFSNGGIDGSGIINPAQVGGYDLNKITINGEVTRNLRGLKLSDGTVIERDILVTEMPHPSALSRLTPMDAAKRVGESLRVLLPYQKKGWMVEPDAGWTNKWHQGEPYRYGRAEIRPGFYEFGTPGIRMVSVSSASRMSGKPHVIVSGTRDRVRFNDKAIDEATRAKPSQMPDPRELWTARPRLPESRYIFDRGPGEKVAQALKGALNLKEIFETKPGKNFKTDGIDAFNVKTAPEVLDFGHHRGSFENSKAIIVADPHGVDDLFTSRALTGARGQYLNGLMHDIGINESYLVIKTVPFGMDGATALEWKATLSKTEKYRELAVQLAMEKGTVEYIFADGENAAKEVERITQKLGLKNVKIVNIQRDGMDAASGIKEAGAELQKLNEFKGKKITAKMRDIPRSHLTWFSRIWEGTGGDRVLDAVDKNRGSAFASVVPEWVVRQKVTPSQWVQRSIDNLRTKLTESGMRTARESMAEYVGRTGLLGTKLIELLADVAKTNGKVVDLAAKRAAKDAVTNNVSVKVTDKVTKPVSVPVSSKVADLAPARRPAPVGSCSANF